MGTRINELDAGRSSSEAVGSDESIEHRSDGDQIHHGRVHLRLNALAM